ncbi:helix-turn-helix domain-containing protein [Streptomyces sp. NPDC051704]|uniref:helix-turn-helix domain-containing protein n=1 Tax=Streptomyces sp. NPDC051704 TaxID=3365671 RepID=UPI0037B9D342
MGVSLRPTQQGPRSQLGRAGDGERILRAAEELFSTRGIHATGVAALIKAAHVSPRTFHMHLPTKNALVEEYLRRFESEKSIAAEAELEREDLPWPSGCRRPLPPMRAIRRL